MLTAAGNRGSRADWTSVPLHPVMVAAVPVLFLFAENVEQQLTLAPLWAPLGLSLAIGAGTLLGCALLLRRWHLGAVLASWLLILFFSFGHVWRSVAGFLPGAWLLAAIWLALGLGGLALIWLARRWRGGRWALTAGSFLNLAALLLLALNGYRVATYASQPNAARALTGSEEVSLVAPAEKRDIYYIILDRYASSETLASLYEFDNEPFLRELERRGFTVARESRANYFKTAPSLASSLSMDYLDMAQLRGTPGDEFGKVYAALGNHLAVPAALKRLGYGYVHIGNYWEPTARNVDADVALRFQDYAEFSTALWATTLMTLFASEAEQTAFNDEEATAEFDLARSTTLYAFDRLEESAGRPGPTYVFAHLLVPHDPYVFDADGSLPTPEEARERGYVDEYLAQLTWANQRMLAAIDRILESNAETDPIIVLQADEGPFPYRFQVQQGGFQWFEATDEEIQEKYGILNAVRYPGVDAAAHGFHDSVSPVNQFRILFNAYFDAGLPLLPDVTYLSRDYQHWWELKRHPRD